MKKSKTTKEPSKAVRNQPPMEADSADSLGSRAVRETVESIAVAVILAFLFRAFVAEAFVIPTGSMAPTLQGRHMDVTCEKCGCPYRTGASEENDGRNSVTATICPVCRYPMSLDKIGNPNQRSFNGDRILVSKFCYEFTEPKRWDVIVFKYPGNAKQNYIKRLVGLPEETLWIRHGDIYTRPGKEGLDGDEGFRIARKPPHKVKAMSQLVDDTAYRAPELTQAGWPCRWQDWSSPDAPSWRPSADGQGFETTDAAGAEAWLRYQHLVPQEEDWEAIDSGITVVSDRTGRLISDFCTYNHRYLATGESPNSPPNWVGDLSLLANVDVQGSSGELLLDLVEGGVHYGCRIDVSTGEATLAINNGEGEFTGDDGQAAKHPKGSSRLRGAGSYSVRFSNFDDQLLLWVGESLVKFDGPTTYTPAKEVKPVFSESNPGDLLPVGIGAKGVAVRASRLRVLRDIYYIAAKYERLSGEQAWFQRKAYSGDYEGLWHPSKVAGVFASPAEWGRTTLFDDRREDVRFVLEEDQFFPMGDNSPASKDARIWSDGIRDGKPFPDAFVERRLLTGKALVVYWPHAWRRPLPFLPNVERMGLIR